MIAFQISYGNTVSKISEEGGERTYLRRLLVVGPRLCRKGTGVGKIAGGIDSADAEQRKVENLVERTQKLPEKCRRNQTVISLIYETESFFMFPVFGPAFLICTGAGAGIENSTS
jgi:hypothetical protein